MNAFISTRMQPECTDTLAVHFDTYCYKLFSSPHQGFASSVYIVNIVSKVICLQVYPCFKMKTIVLLFSKEIVGIKTI